MTLTEFVKVAVESYEDWHGEGMKSVISTRATQTAQTVDASPRLTGNEKRLIDAFNNLSPEAQKALLKFLDALQS